MLTLMEHPRAFILVIVCAFIPALMQGCSDTGLKEVPKHLIGKWMTDEPRYEGRYLIFAPETVTFGTGAGTFFRNAIKKIKFEDTGGGIAVYKLDCVNSYGEKDPLTVTYNSNDGGSIKVGHIQATWWKVEKQQAGSP